ncbi:zinc finger protein 182-like [Lampris incognitus]|uniref:zinc finger protein 182-like n=1 Tax=Lampris incognitus TaxID=2546036 RepID=UPI0024B61E6C|nr:zinc finger protein 182-like [Lampris incognitus]
MSRTQMLRLFVQQCLTAAAEEIFGLFEKTIEEYEEQIDRQRRLLAHVTNASEKTDPPQLFDHKEVPSEQQEWTTNLSQEELEPTHIKEEQGELWTSQEEEQLQRIQEPDNTKLPFPPVPVKRKNAEGKPPSSQLHQCQTKENKQAELSASTSSEQMKTEHDGEDFGLSEPASNLDQDGDLEPTSDGEPCPLDYCESETEDSDGDMNKTREPWSGLDAEDNEISHQISIKKKPFICSVCGKGFAQRGQIQPHMRTHTGEKPFSCTICGKEFSQRGQIQPHMRTHTGEKPFSCSICGKRFCERGHLQTHMRTHTGEKSFSCMICGKGFSQRGNMQRHIRTHIGEKPLVAQSLVKGFLDEEMCRHWKLSGNQFDVRKPMTNELMNNLFNDFTPAQLVAMLRLVVQQRLTAAAEEIFGVFEKTIEEYEEEIDRQRRLLAHWDLPWCDHKIQPLNKDVFLCLDPPQLFDYKEEVPSEQQEWTDNLGQEELEPPHIKEEQEELWTSQEEERLQRKEEADNTKLPFLPVPVKRENDEGKPESSQLHQSQTGENKQTEPSASNYAEQMKIESDGEDFGLSEPEDSDDDWNKTREPWSSLDAKDNEISQRSVKKKPLICSACNKGFTERGNLQRHMRTHTGEKPFICSVCGKGFSQNVHIQAHMRRHTGEKPFSCTVCGKGFSQRGERKEHMRTHTGEKPFSCSVCSNTFSHKGTLHRHIRTHTGEKPFTCSVCGKAFTQNGHIQAHMRTHTGEKPFSCTICGKGFSQNGNMHVHMRTHTE